MKIKHTPWDSIIICGNDTQYLTLKVTSKGKDIPLICLESSNGKFATLNVPYTLFSDTYEECLESNSFHFIDLEETTTLSRDGMSWLVTQSWGGEDTTVTKIPHKEMIKLMQHCSRYVQTGIYLRKTFNKSPLDRLVLNLTKLFWLPSKLL